MSLCGVSNQMQARTGQSGHPSLSGFEWIFLYNSEVMVYSICC
jgi:hypothetical protein